MEEMSITFEEKATTFVVSREEVGQEGKCKKEI